MHFFLMRYHYRINALVNLATMKGWMEVTSPPPLPLLSLASGQSIFLGGRGGGVSALSGISAIQNATII